MTVPTHPPTLLATILATLALLASACSSGGEDASETLHRVAQSAARPAAEGAAGAATPDAGAPPAEGLPDGWEPTPLQWSECADVPAGDCATLEVPLDWDEPEGDTLTLALARTRASGDRIGTLVTNPGGPGASGLRFLAASPLPTELTERFDVLSWDPRGVGSSTSVTCDDGVDDLMAADPEPDDDAEVAELRRAARTVSQACARSDGRLLEHLGTEDVARDLEAIRLALGNGPLNYLGFSYGTQIGQVYAAMFGDRIRSMVLDAVVDPAAGFEEFLVGQARAFERSFDRNAEACVEAGAARCGVEDLAAAYDDVADRLETAPLGSGATRAGPAELVTGTILTSYGAEGWQSLGPALAAARRGDGSALRRLADSYRDLGGYTAYAAVVCIDSPPPRGEQDYAAFADRAAQAAPRFGAAIANELLPCATWPAAPVGEPAALTAPDAPPMLLVANTGDAATPYENAERVAARLDGSVLLTVDSDGHGASTSNTCVATHVARYLVRLELPGAGTRCT